ncbi:phage tail protein [Bacillus amyloliquefaciens]
MNQMFVEDKQTGQKYELIDAAPRVNDATTGKKEMTFTYSLEEATKLPFNALVGRNIIYIDERVHKSQRYFIRDVQTSQDGENLTKTVTATHIYLMRLQGHRIDKIISGTQSLDSALKHALEDSGFSYKIMPDAMNIAAQKLDNFGDKFSIELMDDIQSTFEVEFDVDNTTIYVHKKMGRKINKTLDVQANVNGIQLSVSETNTTTRIRGYGKLKDEKDILSNDSISYDSKTGEWSFDSALNADYTKKTGAVFKFSFTGTGFSFTTLVSKLGGKWKFQLDKDTSKSISVYKDVSNPEKQTIEVVRGLTSKKYDVTATFSGRDSSNPNTKGSKKVDPVMYLLRGNIIQTYRNFENDNEKYVFPPVLYVHPDEKNFLIDGRPIWADTVRDDSITKEADMLAVLKKKVNPFPEVALDVDFEEFDDPRLEGIEDEITKGDTLHVIADTERNGTTFEDDVRAISMTYNPLDKRDKPEITFNNFRKDIYDLHTDSRRRINQQQKYFQSQTASVAASIEAAKKEILATVKTDIGSTPSSLSYVLQFNAGAWEVISGAGEASLSGNTINLDTDDDLQVVSADVDTSSNLKQGGYVAGLDYNGTPTNRFSITLFKNESIVNPATVSNGSKIYVNVVAFK